MVHSIETHPMISMHADADVAEAASLMADCGIGALGVLGPDRRFVGIVTERDVLALVGRRKDLTEVTLADVVNERPVVVEGTISEEDALARMTTAHIRHLVVREGEDFRILSLRDLVKVPAISGRSS